MLSYDLDVTGVAKVKGAIRSLTNEWRRHNEEVTKSARGAGLRGTDTSAKRKQTATERTNAQAEAKKQAQIKREEAAEKRAADRAAAHKERLQQQLSRRQLARFKQETIAKNREESRALAQRERAEQALARRRLARFKAETLRNDRLMLASRSAMLGGAYRGAMAPLGAVGRTAKMAVGLAGSYVVGSSVAKQFAAERSATNLANKAFGTPGEERTREQIKQSLMAQSEAIGAVTGNRAGVIEAMDKFVAISGSLPGAQQIGQFMADISDATGAEMGDVGRTGGQVLQNLMSARSIDPRDTAAMNAALEDTKSIMAAMAGQAKIGSIEFSDLARSMGSVMSATTRFEGNVADLANEMGAIAQLAIAGGATSPEEAMTSIKRFSDDLVRNSKRFDKMTQGMGIQSFFTNESKTQLRAPTEIITDVMRATGGDLTKVQKIFNIRSMKAFEPFQKAVMEEQKTGKTFEEALSTVETKIGRFTSTKMTQEEVKTSATFSREQTGRRFQIAWEDMQMKVGKELAPAVEDLIPAFVGLAKVVKDLAPYLSAFMKAFAKNPLLIGGGLLAGRMGLGGVFGGIGGALSVPGMAGGSALAGGGGRGFSLSGLFGSFGGSGMPVKVTNFPAVPGGGGAPTPPVVPRIGGSVLTGLGLGSALASAIYAWGTSEVERREQETTDVMQEAKFGDPKKAKREAKKKLEKVQNERQAEKDISEAATFAPLVGGMPGGPAMGYNPIVTPMDTLSEQKKFDEENLKSSKQIAEYRINMEKFDAFIERSKEGVTVLDGFYKKLNEFETPKGGQNRSDKPSAVKDM